MYLLSGLAHQWIYVAVYNLELRDYFPKTGSKNSQPTVQDEISALVQKCKIRHISIQVGPLS